jgi:hypothetical protein
MALEKPHGERFLEPSSFPQLSQERMPGVGKSDKDVAVASIY